MLGEEGLHALRIGLARLGVGAPGDLLVVERLWRRLRLFMPVRHCSP